MSTTAKDIIEAAYARRTANHPEKLATKSELISVLSRFLQRISADVAKVNPWYFSTQEDVTGSSGVWDRPASAVVVMHVENASGTEVSIVPFRQRDAEMAPRIYPLGRTFKTVGEASDPSGSDVLTFTFSERLDALDSTAQWDAAANTLADTWPEHHNDLLADHLAAYLAIKDGRADSELAALSGEIQAGVQSLIAEVDIDDYGQHQKWSDRPPGGS